MTFTLDRRFLLAGLGGALAAPELAFAKASDWPALKALEDSYIDAHRLPGMVIAVKRGKDSPVFFSKGAQGLEDPTPVTPTSLFRVYSMTKPITGFAVMKLIEEGKLSLDQPVSDVVPELGKVQVLKNPADPAAGTEPLARPILIRHLLTHTAGLGYSILPGAVGKLYTKYGIVPGGRATEKEPGADYAPVQTLDEMAQRLAMVPLGAQPGTRWSYSVGLDVLGLVIQRVSKTPFDVYLQRAFFTPLRMNDTFFTVPAAKASRLTAVQAMKDGKLATTEAGQAASPFAKPTGLYSGGGGLVSTAADYIRFTSMLLNEGTLDGRRVLKPETVRLGMSNLMPAGVAFRGFGPGGAANGYGAGGSVILTGGETPGRDPATTYSWFGIAGTQMWVDPVNKLSVVCMIQMYPNSTPIQGELRTAAYKDLAAMKTSAA